MKKTLLFTLGLFSTGVFAQEHFSGINISRRTGLLNASINPAELTNLKSNYEVNMFNFSGNIANNKMTFGDLVGSNDNFDDMLFAGNEPVNMRADVEILGPAFGFKMEKWAFAITTGAKIKADIIDVNPALGRALTNGVSSVAEITAITANYNQKTSATIWGEIGFSAARELYDSEMHKFSAGVTFKMLFPGSYANIAAGNFRGTVESNFGDVNLTDASAMVNVAYSGSLADDFTDSSNFSSFFGGGLNGFSTDIGVDYQWKDTESTGYKLNAGLAVRNLGSMTFKDNNNVSRNYNLLVPQGQSLDLNQFENVSNLKELEQILLANPQFFTAQEAEKDFKVTLPTMLSAYADVKLYSIWFASLYMQQKMNKDNDNQQIAIQNIFTITPRYSANSFEVYTPLSHNEISGFTAGVGLRLGGFFIGSGSILSAALGDTDQADAYMGFRFGF
ncbi:hypothetical protein HYN59_13135 [Flavobacterium album]|uniref:DUF5723 domain-containing protein n=1 Tax=Flavobacterium album TaxID=2175091 RepID=A0A2S1QZY8_9FLAO|nr:hypothetical protein [Flavobacterium album]AWH85993.1 hypothetical protein HYN59_13135 [Flavobacterium album]